MNLPNIQAVILAAGKSSRFKTDKSKLLHKICGQKIIIYVTRVLEKLHIPTTVVVGYQKEYVMNSIKKQHGDTVTFAVQEEQKGTGHALASSRNYWREDNILILNGDMPLITKDIIESLYHQHCTTNAAVSFVIAHNDDPALEGYGRIVRTGKQVEIVEAKEFTGDPEEHCCINAGIYLVRRDFLEQSIDELKVNAVSHEFYITDLIKNASQKDLVVTTVAAPFDRVRGINTFQELWAAEQIKRAELIRYWMEHGVRFSVAHNVHLDLEVVIGAGSYIGCGTHLLGKTTLGKNCKIHEFSAVENCTLGDNVVVHPQTIVKDTTIGSDTQVGPFAHVRESSHLGKSCVVSNFVEIKNSIIGDNTRVKHGAYLGDASVGANVNVGAGTVTCNYDSVRKHRTVIEDGCFIGTNTTLVAPVTVGKHAFTAAGSTITEDVPENALAIARTRQENKPDYADVIRERKLNAANADACTAHPAALIDEDIITTHSCCSPEE